MDIYSIGEERCIDGTWGRMVGKRFYTHTTELDGEVFLARALDVDSVFKTYVGLFDALGNKVLNEEVVRSNLIYWYQKEQVKFKRGDVVWVKTFAKSGGTVWSPVVYLSTLSDSSGFYCTEVFNERGIGIGCTGMTYKEVFLKPPFEF